MILNCKINCIGNAPVILCIQCIGCKVLPYAGVCAAYIFRSVRTREIGAENAFNHGSFFIRKNHFLTSQRGNYIKLQT